MFRSFKSKVPMLLVAMISILVLSIACGGEEDPTATTRPTAVPAATSTSAPAMAPVAYIPTTEDLGGGSPAGFARIFENAINTSTAQAASEYADAAKPVAAGEKLKIGFIFVGSQQDLGYNQAAYEGSQFLVQQHPDVEILYAENIPETAQVKSVMEGMIQQGAKVIFATSFGYSDATKELAEQHPGIIFLHQGDLESTPNYGAYFGNIWQLEYAMGQAAGRSTETNELGFVAAFPIPQTLLNVNAFHLGALSVNPDVSTTFVLLGDWCDPAKQAAAAQTMLDAGVDVITQHQDCTGTITTAAERAEIFVTGYHQDASPAAPNGWLSGAVWNWGPVYSELMTEIKNGTYKTNVFFGGLEEGFVKLAPFGANVPEEIQQEVLATVEGLRDGSIQPFLGPISDQSGTVRIAAGESPADADLQIIDWLVEGVSGSTN